jgi:geranylgeranyl pyrophosphate synthase
MRRGKKAHHLIYGVNQSINAGDALHMIMWKALQDNAKVFRDYSKVNLVFDEFYSMLMRTCVGQTAEMDWRNSYDLTENEVNYILDGKTGYYTIAGPMRLGAIIAGRDPIKDKSLFSTIDEFGLNLGRAFQITDDILDISSDFGGLKERGNDIQEGKRSLLFVRLLKTLSEADLVKFKKIMNKEIGTKSKEEIELVIGWMEKYNVIESAKNEALDFAVKSKDILNKLPFSVQIKSYFSELIDFLVQRSY